MFTGIWGGFVIGAKENWGEGRDQKVCVDIGGLGFGVGGFENWFLEYRAMSMSAGHRDAYKTKKKKKIRICPRQELRFPNHTSCPPAFHTIPGFLMISNE